MPGVAGLEWPEPKPGVATVGVIGWPVKHSLSPAIHNAAFASLGLDWEYVRLPVPPGLMPEAVAALKSRGFRGANVTMPHKLEAFLACDSATDDATRLRSVNTLTVEGLSLSGDNTDAPGFAAFLAEDAGWDPAGHSALIYGAGGAGRACALALARGGVRDIAVAVRDRSRAGDLLHALDGCEPAPRVIAFDEARQEDPELIVNATPLGMAGESLPLPELGPGNLVIDLVYHPEFTPLLETAAAARATAFGGLGLLVHQAALSFLVWTGKIPDIAVLSGAAKQQLGA